MTWWDILRYVVIVTIGWPILTAICVLAMALFLVDDAILLVKAIRLRRQWRLACPTPEAPDAVANDPEPEAKKDER